MIIPVKRSHPAAQLPRRAHAGDAGADLCAVEQVVIGPGERGDVGTGLALAVPEGYVGLVMPRSGLAFRHGILVANAPGVIDASYRGEVRVCLYNSGPTEFVVEPGDRIAQLVVEAVALPEFIEATQLTETPRGSAGFGSTGQK